MSMVKYCWMCQLGTFLSTTGITADLYDLVNLDNPTPHPYQRMAVHVPYEPWDGRFDGCAGSKNMSLAHKLGSCMDKRTATSEVAIRRRGRSVRGESTPLTCRLKSLLTSGSEGAFRPSTTSSSSMGGSSLTKGAGARFLSGRAHLDPRGTTVAIVVACHAL